MPIRDVFIIMPFSEQRSFVGGRELFYSTAHFDDLYAILLDAVREYSADVIVNRMEQAYGNLVEAIIRRLHSADVVVAVLAGRNPNVFYELGIRHSLRLNTIMLVENREEYPFDLSAYFSHEYAIAHERDRRSLKAFIRERLESFARAPLPDSPVLDVLQRAEVEHLRVLNMWETRRAVVMLDGLMHEALAINALVLEIIDEAQRDPNAAYGSRMRLTWDVIDGFTKTRPIPGLPASAYVDAESIYREWRQLEQSWNTYLEASEMEEDERRFAQYEALGAVLAGTVGFVYDIAFAADFVIREQRAYGIPWRSAYRELSNLHPLSDVLVYIEDAIAEGANAVFDRLVDFERHYLGVPPEHQAANSSVPSLREFDDILTSARNAKKKARASKKPNHRRKQKR